MADPRRRKIVDHDNSEYESDESQSGEIELNLSCEGSEYESADEDGNASKEGNESKHDDDDKLREDTKPLDHDEDRKNPQYIPKKGTFYEHDDRNAEVDGEEGVKDEDTESPSPIKKEPKVWKEKEKWGHESFNLEDQKPKSREELIACYGYDIRNEDGPPRARRRRRYGRGPNKYTRNWEDEDAYAKPRITDSGRGRGQGRRRTPQDFNPSSESEFPSLSNNMGRNKEKDNSQIVDESPSYKSKGFSKTEGKTRGSYGRGRIQRGEKQPVVGRDRQRAPASDFNRKQFDSSEGAKRAQFNHRKNEENGQNANLRRQPGSSHASYSQNEQSEKIVSAEVKDISQDLHNLSLKTSHKDEYYYPSKPTGGDSRKISDVQPRQQDNESPQSSLEISSKPKRYSSQRQKSLQDHQMPHYGTQQVPPYYDQNAPADNTYQTKIFERNDSPSAPPPVNLTGQTQPGSFVTQPHPPFRSTPPRLFSPAVTQPPHLMGAPPPGPSNPSPVPVPPVPGQPPFLPPENLINYAAGAPPALVPPGAPLASQFPPFQPFAAPPPPPVAVPQTAPQEIYSNGVMYYNMETQHHIPRVIPTFQKRPKAAIPIVPPPDREASEGAYTPPGYYQELPMASPLHYQTSPQSETPPYVVSHHEQVPVKQEVISAETTGSGDRLSPSAKQGFQPSFDVAQSYDNVETLTQSKIATSKALNENESNCTPPEENLSAALIDVNST